MKDALPLSLLNITHWLINVAIYVEATFTVSTTSLTMVMIMESILKICAAF